jgi:hypothetical protein
LTFIFSFLERNIQSEVACGCIFRVTRGRTVASAVIQRAQARAAFNDFAMNFDLRLTASLPVRYRRAVDPENRRRLRGD